MRRACDTIYQELYVGEARCCSAEHAERTIDRITVTTSLGLGCQDADLIIEAIYENSDAKRRLFAAIDKVSGFNSTL